MSDPDEISPSRAQELIEQADGGLLVTIHTEPKATIGVVPIDEREVDIQVKTHSFGDWEGDDV